MAVMYITEYADLGLAQGPGGALIQAPQEPPVATQTLAIGSAVASANFNTKTRLIRLHCDAICSYLFSVAGTAAATTDSRMAAGQTEYHAIAKTQADTGFKVNVISNT